MLDLKFGTLYHLILETLEAMKNSQRELSSGLPKIVLVSFIAIISITLAISTSHIFGTSFSEVF